GCGGTTACGATRPAAPDRGPTWAARGACDLAPWAFSADRGIAVRLHHTAAFGRWIAGDGPGRGPLPEGARGERAGVRTSSLAGFAPQVSLTSVRSSALT